MEESSIAPATPPTFLRVIAKIVSYLFHPLFIPTYIFIWLTIRYSYEFNELSPFQLFLSKIRVFWMTAFFPAFAVFLCWRVKFIDNIHLRTQKERIIPYIISMFFYWWMWYLSIRVFTGDRQGQQPEVLKFFFLGIGFTTVVGLILNNFYKISMHAMGVGGAVACVILTGFYYHIYIGFDIALAILAAGVTCTSRLILNEHSNRDIYSGLIVGALCQLIAYYFAM